MWRLVLSGLLCLPALVLLLLSRNDDTSHVSRVTFATPPVAAIQVSLPPSQFPAEPGLPDPGTWDNAALIVSLPLQEEFPGTATVAPPVAFSISQVPPRSLKTPTRGFAEFETASRSRHHASKHSGLLAFLSRNLTRNSFAPPNQNGGG